MREDAHAYSDSDRERKNVKSAYDAVADALESLGMDNFDRYVRLQEAYFDLKAALRALDPEFQAVDMPGTEVNVPRSLHCIEGNPTVRDEGGEWEFPTKCDDFAVLDGLQVCRPKNPHTTYAVHVDHVISPDGEVAVEVNGHPLSEIPCDDSREW